MFGTCDGCGATCTRVFLVERTAETGMCSRCIAIRFPRADVHVTGSHGCEHPTLLPSMDAPHPRRDPEAYEAWLNREKQCPVCSAMVAERDL